MKIKIKKFKKVKSTNDIALKLIKQYISEPTMIIANKQTHGRGRAGKEWISKKGNLLISIFFKLDQKKINFKQFAILNALLLKNVISKIILRKIELKWPNDLLYKKMKFCGILQEVVEFNNFEYLIVGIGLKNILNKKVNNQKILMNIKTAYEKLLKEKNKLSLSSLKRKYK